MASVCSFPVLRFNLHLLQDPHSERLKMVRGEADNYTDTSFFLWLITKRYRWGVLM